jgi:DtxR family Mn-dependent transcriptional regulator
MSGKVFDYPNSCAYIQTPMNANARKFATPGLSHSATHHLMAVGSLMDEHGYARVSDIARTLNVTRGSVSVAMQALRSAGYVTQDERRFFHLTERGETTIASIRSRHEIVERFLHNVLGLADESAHRESCRMEYLIEGPTASRLADLIRYWTDQNLDAGFSEYQSAGCSDCLQDGAECPCCSLECVEDTAACPRRPAV